MNDALNPGIPPPEQLIGEMCGRFEESWLEGRVPRLEEVVLSAPELCRPELFRELLVIESEYRAHAQRPITLTEAQDRFGPLGRWTASIIEELLGETGSWQNHRRHDTPAPDRPLSRNCVGQYELLAKLGSGAYGTVFKARHRQLKRHVALKVLIPHRVHTPGGIERFRREMEVLGQLNHPHIIRATDAGEAEGYFYLAMEFVEGVDLGHLLRKVSRLAIADVCEIIRQAAEALAYIDRNGMVHRDVKPNNLLLGQDGILRILDLGLAQLRDVPPGERLTETGAVMGTADYISPEQARESRDVNIRADIYSLGCTLFALLTGSPPFARAESIYDLFKAHNEMPPPSIGTIRDDVPPDLERLIFSMLEKNSSQRPSPDEVAHALLPFCAGNNLGQLVEECGPTAEIPLRLPPVLHQLDVDRTGTHLSVPPSTTLQAIKTPPSTTGRIRRWAVAAAAIAITIGGVVWATGALGSRSSEKSPNKNPLSLEQTLPKPSLLPRTFKAGEWTDLLDRPPVVREFPELRKGSHWLHDEKTHQLYINSTEWGVFELEQLKGVAFDFEATMSQNPWVGGVGAFFRGWDDELGSDAIRWGDFLFLQCFGTTPANEPARLGIGDLRRFKTTGHFFPSYTDWVDVPRPLFDTHKLAFSMSAAGLTNVTWDGKAVAPLILPARLPGPLPGQGQGVGLVVQNCATWFHSVRIRIL